MYTFNMDLCLFIGKCFLLYIPVLWIGVGRYRLLVFVALRQHQCSRLFFQAHSQRQCWNPPRLAQDGPCTIIYWHYNPYKWSKIHGFPWGLFHPYCTSYLLLLGLYALPIALAVIRPIFLQVKLFLQKPSSTQERIGGVAGDKFH